MTRRERVGQSILVEPVRRRREDGASPAQILLVVMILAVVALAVTWSLGRVGL